MKNQWTAAVLKLTCVSVGFHCFKAIHRYSWIIWSVWYPPWSKENNTILKKVYYYYHYYNYHQHYHCCYYSLFAVPGKFKILKITIIMNRIWYEKSVLYHSHIRFLIICNSTSTNESFLTSILVMIMNIIWHGG